MTEFLIGERLFESIPVGTQDWRLFITPDEMKEFLESSGFGMLHEDLTGLCEDSSFKLDITGPFPYVRRTMAYKHCKELTGHYMSWATKEQSTPDLLETDDASVVEEDVNVKSEL